MSTPTITPSRPLADVIGPLRTAHREHLRGVAEWALAAGYPIDLDIAALALATVPRRTEYGPLDRDLMVGLLRRLGYEADRLGAARPEHGEVEALWAVLSYLDTTQQLPAGSAPLPALLEPLQCYGMLGPDGRQRPDDVDIDFACQCPLPYDPTLPAGMSGWLLPGEFAIHADRPPRSADLPVSVYRPAIRFARRLRASGRNSDVHLDDLQYMGRIPDPGIWIYLVAERGQLLLDADGKAWWPKPHKGRRLGFRWVEMTDSHAKHWSGLFERMMEWDRIQKGADARTFGEPECDLDDPDW